MTWIGSLSRGGRRTETQRDVGMSDTAFGIYDCR